jgi:hypothetical protein
MRTGRVVTGLALAIAGLLATTGCQATPSPRAGGSSPGGPTPAPATSAPAASERATAAPSTGPSGAGLPPYRHIVVVVEENHASSQVLGSAEAPFINSLATGGALMTRSYAVSHPSEPNYLALFSGSTQGVTDDSCPHTFSGENLGHQLIAAGHSFVGYSESMPADGYTGCVATPYVRKHNPWVNFTNVPASANRTLGAFPNDYASLPTVSFVVPNRCSDMHDCPVRTGDTWLRDHLGGYADWAKSHDSLLVVTFDEDDDHAGNHIATIFSGAHVAPGRYGQRVTHYGVLRTVQALTGLACTGNSCSAGVILGIWN